MARKPIEATDYQIGQDKPRDMPMTGDAHLDDPLIETVAGPGFNEKAAALQFMEEVVDVIVHDSTDQNAEPVVSVFCNGRSQFFLRNEVQSVKRKFVEVLARAKTTTYKQEYFKDANGDNAIRNIPRTALRYPFSIQHDPNPNGRAWLQKVLAEA